MFEYWYDYYLFLDLESLESIILGDYVFDESHHTEISSMFISSNYLSDLPHLTSIQLGFCTLFGSNDDDCSLLLQGN